MSLLDNAHALCWQNGHAYLVASHEQSRQARGVHSEGGSALCEINVQEIQLSAPAFVAMKGAK